MPLRAHFLNVGRGDCTIIEFPSGRVGMIDLDTSRCLDPTTWREKLQRYREAAIFTPTFLAGGDAPLNVREAAFLAGEQMMLTDALDYYDRNLGAERDLFRLLITHPDMDHMTGLHRLHHDARKEILNFWHTGRHDFNLATTTDEEWEDCPYDKRDWDTYRELRDGTNPRSLQKHQGSTGQYWTEDGLELWAPTPELERLAEERQEPNILSMIIKVTHAGRSILLGGDATGDETWSAIYPKVRMDGITVLKASHHGRKTGYHQASVKEMAPWLTITSVGRVEHDATESYRQYSQYTVSLRRAADIQITIEDDGRVHYPPTIEQYWKPRLP